MPEHSPQQQWVDRYVRDELSADEMAVFEETLMGSPELQQELETALALQELLAAVPEQVQDSEKAAPQPLSGGGNWQGLALAATVVLAVFSTVMYWKTSNEFAGLQIQLDQLREPRTEVLTVPIDIMRSGGTQTPDVIVQKPGGHSAMLLDIELAPASRQHDSLHFSLVDQAENQVSSWSGSPTPDGQATVVLYSEQVPATRLWLEISTESGEVLERRLLEFR